jgi:YD repeat-containing protein
MVQHCVEIIFTQRISTNHYLECCEFINPLRDKALRPQKFALRIPKLPILNGRMRFLGTKGAVKWLLFLPENAVNLCYTRYTRIHNTQGYDLKNRRISVTDALGKTTTTAYDSQGNIASITDSEQNTTIYTYDILNRKTSDTNEFGDVQTYRYDAVGNRIGMTDRNGREQSFTYDKNNQLETENWLNADGSINRTITYVRDDAGRLTSVSDPNSQYVYTYDDANRLVSVGICQQE